MANNPLRSRTARRPVGNVVRSYYNSGSYAPPSISVASSSVQRGQTSSALPSWGHCHEQSTPLATVREERRRNHSMVRCVEPKRSHWARSGTHVLWSALQARLPNCLVDCSWVDWLSRAAFALSSAAVRFVEELWGSLVVAFGNLPMAR